MQTSSKDKLRITIEELFLSRPIWSVVVVEDATNRVISLSQVNEAAMKKTLSEGICHYWDDVNQVVYLKGEHSDEIETLKEMRLDICHARRHTSSLLFRVDLAPGKCMFGASCCHFYKWDGEALSIDDTVIIDKAACKEHWTRANTLLTEAEDVEHMKRYVKPKA